MKNPYKLITIIALTLAITLPVLAQTDDRSQSSNNYTTIHTDASVPDSNPIPLPQDQGQPGPDMPPPNGRPSIRAVMRADINTRVENAENNQNIRNAMLEHHFGTSSPMYLEDQDQNGNDDTATDSPHFRDGMPHGPRPHMASTSMMMGSTTMGMHDRREMRMSMFEERKRIVTKEFDVAISNLNNISSRLDSRIQKEQTAGHNMTDAIGSLASANTKIQVATDAVTSLESYLPNASSTETASTTINLDTARNLVSAAQAAIKEAQHSLNDVVTAIAHELGIKLETEASSTVSQ